jgi:hypothetical protein
MMRPKFMLLPETPMMPMLRGWISRSIFWIGRGRRCGGGAPSVHCANCA